MYRVVLSVFTLVWVVATGNASAGQITDLQLYDGNAAPDSHDLLHERRRHRQHLESRLCGSPGERRHDQPRFIIASTSGMTISSVRPTRSLTVSNHDICQQHVCRR